MFTTNIDSEKLSLRDKFFSIDYILLLTVLIIGVISCFAMYSTDRGEVGYHTISHLLRFGVFYVFFIFVSLIKINFCFNFYLSEILFEKYVFFPFFLQLRFVFVS